MSGETLSPREDNKAKELYKKHKESTSLTEDDLGMQPTHKERLRTLKEFEKGQKKNEKILRKSEEHYRENEEKYKQQAVHEAHEAGVDVDYPPYTDQPSSDQDPNQPK